jgi:hypothetical protein
MSNVLYVHTMTNASGHIFSTYVYALEEAKKLRAVFVIVRRATDDDSSSIFTHV